MPGQNSRLFDIRDDDEARAVSKRHASSKTKLHRKAVKVFSGSTFKELPICERLIKHMSEGLKMEKLTAPQQLASPLLLQNQDVMIKSPTGTGKTLAYALPVVNDLQGLQHKVGGIRVVNRCSPAQEPTCDRCNDRTALWLSS
jgi:ATP-dependent RNA helicase DDX31/DBP7